MTYWLVKVLMTQKKYLVETEYEAKVLRGLLNDVGAITEMEEVDVHTNVYAVAKEVSREIENMDDDDDDDYDDDRYYGVEPWDV